MLKKQEIFSNPENNKNELWEKMRGRIDLVKDRLGLGIDENIKEAVIGLSLFEINTVGSCEGHLDHGTRAPYIDIQAKDIPEKEKEIEQFENDKTKRKKIIEEITQMDLAERKKIIPLLDEFYTSRISPFHSRLIPRSNVWGETRIESLGAELQEIENEETKKMRLKEYQDEMKAFSNFLKEKYFAQGSLHPQ